MILDQLNILESSGLIRLVQSEPDLEYLFRHVLAQDAVYNSLLKQQRRHWHLAVAHALERAYPHQLNELAAMLGRHFDEGGDDARALKYLTEAGEQAARRYANVEAIMFFDRALEVAQRAEANGHPDEEALTHLVLRRGRLLEMSGKYAEALASYEELERIAHERHSRTMELQALMARATVFCAPTDHFDAVRGEETTQRALALAHAMNDRAAEAKVQWLILLLCKFTRNMPRGVQAGERSATIARELGLRELLAYTLNDIFPAYMTTGHSDQGVAALQESERLWREMDNQPLLIDTLTNLAELNQWSGNVELGMSQIQEAHRISTAIGNVWGQGYSAGVLGALLAERGEYGAAIRMSQKAIDLSVQAGFALGQVLPRASLAMMFADLGDYRRGKTLAEKGLAAAEQLVPSWRGQPTAMIALCAIRMRNMAEAEAAYERAKALASPYDLSIMLFGLCQAEFYLLRGDYAGLLAGATENESMLRQFGMTLYVSDLEFYRALALIGLGKLDEAVGALRASIAQAERAGSRRILWRILSTLAECEARRGNTAEAEAVRRRAREEIDFIAAHIDDNGLRDTFLSLPEVRAVSSARAQTRS
jgi:tetratricopeptide (TPR) repeat protein